MLNLVEILIYFLKYLFCLNFDYHLNEFFKKYKITLHI